MEHRREETTFQCCSSLLASFCVHLKQATAPQPDSTTSMSPPFTSLTSRKWLRAGEERERRVERGEGRSATTTHLKVGSLSSRCIFHLAAGWILHIYRVHIPSSRAGGSRAFLLPRSVSLCFILSRPCEGPSARMLTWSAKCFRRLET